MKTNDVVDMKVVSDIEVKLLKRLGSSGQAELYECKIKGKGDQIFTSKTRMVNCNQVMANLMLKECYNEFCLISRLNHPNIVKFKHMAITRNEETT